MTPPPGTPPRVAIHVSRVAIKIIGRLVARRGVRVRVAGLRHIPRDGPVVLASRHYHHVYDAAILLAVVPRPLHFLVALDWAHSRRERRLLELACRLAQWPGLLRAERVTEPRRRGHSAYEPGDVGPYLRAALAESCELLGAGRALVIFPEAYPTIDPEGGEKHGDGFLPFRPGFVRVARMAARRYSRTVPIVPVGFHYERRAHGWRADVRFGPSIAVGRDADEHTVARAVEAAVRELSGAPRPSGSSALASAPPRRGTSGRPGRP